MQKLTISSLTLLSLFASFTSTAEESPNILLIIADDLGVDALNGYHIGTVLPNTPNIDKLKETGLTFTNVWAAPASAPTRASMLTGKYGVNSGVNTVPGILSTNHKSIFKELDEITNNTYATCVVGKWHNARPIDIDHPYSHGADDFMGVNGFGVQDYYKWKKIENHKSSICNEYATSYFTNYASQWIRQQTKPWFMWLAHIAPHTPLHVPPNDMYTSESASTKEEMFIAMIESLDYEVGRLLTSIPQEVLDNTVIIFLGDNGTPGNIIQGFPKRRGKNTLYQGGIHVPLIVSGKGVSRINETEDAMVNVSDFYATIAQIAQPDALPNNHINDSYSFNHLLSATSGSRRKYNYMELGSTRNSRTESYTVRNQQYKIIYNINGEKSFFDLNADPFERTNLFLHDLTQKQLDAKIELEQQMYEINNISFE